MATTFKTSSDLAEEYLVELKSLKPTVNTSQTDSDWWIRSRVFGGLMAGIYADQRLIANDANPLRSRHEALERQLDLYLERGFNPATNAQGDVLVSGTAGTVVPAGGLQFIYAPNGNTYASQEDLTLSAATGLVPVKSIGIGQTQNLNDGAQLTVSSPPSGIDATATVVGGLSDARNPESDTEASAAVVARIRDPLSVGRDSDYVQYAKLADPSVVNASIIRYPFGLGTVGVIITSGTTDIDAAIDAGEPIQVIPSDELVDTVQAFLQQNKPTTDCVSVFKPSALPVDVVVRARYAQGDGNTVLSGQTLTQDELVEREVMRCLYKTPPGGRIFDGLGYVVASEIEETIDSNLSGENVTTGAILPILLDRQVNDLAATGTNLRILANEQPIPGTIQVVPF